MKCAMASAHQGVPDLSMAGSLELGRTQNDGDHIRLLSALDVRILGFSVCVEEGVVVVSVWERREGLWAPWCQWAQMRSGGTVQSPVVRRARRDSGSVFDPFHAQQVTGPPCGVEVATLPATSSADEVMRKVDWGVIPWLLTFAVVCYLDRNNLSYGALQLTADLGIDCHVYGLGAGIFFVGYTLFQVPLSFGTSYFGAPAWMGGTCAVWGALAVAFAATNGIPMFLTLRFLLGVAEASSFPAIWHHLSAFYSPREMTTAYPKVSTANAFSSVLGAPLAALIMRLDTHWGLAGWQWLFALEGDACDCGWSWNQGVGAGLGGCGLRNEGEELGHGLRWARLVATTAT